MPKVRIPTPLRKFTGGEEEVSVSGATVGALITDMENRFPGIRERICDGDGKVRRFVNIYVNGDDIRFLSHLETTVKDADEVSIVPAIAGGCAYQPVEEVRTESGKGAPSMRRGQRRGILLRYSEELNVAQATAIAFPATGATFSTDC